MLYDTVIIGAGPAGMGAGVYVARYKLNSFIIGKELGGMMSEAHLVENYLGFNPTREWSLQRNSRIWLKSSGLKWK